MDLPLRGQLPFHFNFGPPQHEGPEYFMEFLHHFQVFFLKLIDLLYRLLFNVAVHFEPLVEHLRRVEQIWQQVIQQAPQLVRVVLQRRACQQQLEVSLYLSNIHGEHGLLIFNFMGLVYDHVLELKLLKTR